MWRDIADIAQSVSVVFASLFAIYGINAWRREFVGKRRIELAEDVLALFYQARELIQAIRSPFGHVGEGETRKAALGEDPEDTDALDRAFVLIERLNKHSKTFSRIFALRYRFMARFDAKAAKPFDDLNSILNELHLAANRMARLTTPWKDWADLENHQRRMNEVDAVFYGGSENDPIARRVDSLVADIDRTCGNIIRGRRWRFSPFKKR